MTTPTTDPTPLHNFWESEHFKTWLALAQQKYQTIAPKGQWKMVYDGRNLVYKFIEAH